MPTNGGPWEPPTDEEPTSGISRRRWILWVVATLAMVAGLSLLMEVFPGAVDTGEDWAWVGYLVVLMALISTAILTAGRIAWGEKARHAAIWLAIIAVIILGVTYRGELAGVVHRVRLQLSGSHPVTTAPGELVVTGDGGHFFITGQVNGQRVRFLVDTGASETVLSPADATRLGFDPATLTFDQPSQTANGVGYGAEITADSLAVGEIALGDFPMMVNQAPMSESLLGMSFLNRLDSFTFKGDKLYLKAKE